MIEESPSRIALLWAPPEELQIREPIYWRSRFPCSSTRLQTSQEALDSLRGGYYGESNPEEQGQVDGFYPWRVAFSPVAGLPVFLRTRDAPPFSPDGDGVAREAAWSVLKGLSSAVFGVSDIRDDELLPGPIIKLSGTNEGQEATPSRHFTWRQVFRGHPVIGGSVRVHEIVGDPRVSVTSSFFPVEDAPPKVDEEVPEYLLAWRALLAAIATLPRSHRLPFVLGLIKQFLDRWQPGDLSRLGRLLSPLLADGLARWALAVVAGLAAGVPGLERPLMLLGRGLWRLLRLDRRAASAKPVSICGCPRAILPFAGAYHLICRVRLAAPADNPWYADVDVATGQVLGEPWQAVAHSPHYYQNSGEALSGGPPAGDSDSVDLRDLSNYVKELSLAGLPDDDTGRETATAAVHARLFLDHLLTVCGVQPDADRLKGYSLSAAAAPQTPGMAAEIGSAQPTGFVYDAAVNPKEIHFRPSSAATGASEAKAPARDPEVIMHEFAHGFLWLLDPEPWDTPPTLNPFGRALHEGYATYLARSLAAPRNSTAEAGNPNHLWARAAYPESSWGTRWALQRTAHESGADYLPALNSYPSGSYSATDIRVYDVGMIWARALWDLRRLVGPDQADWLAVQAYPYLHGYIANFELAAEGMLDVDIRRRLDINLANGTQPLWASRGVAAGQGVHGMAQTRNDITIGSVGTKLLIAGTDAGVLISKDDGSTWTLESGAGAPGGITAVAASDGVLYVAAQVAVTDAAGLHTQWKPAVYRKDFGPGSSWQMVDAWPDTETPMCLLSLSNGDLVAGTTQGAQKFQQTAAAAPHWTPDQSGIQSQAVLGLASAGTHLWGCSPTWIVRRTVNSAAPAYWQTWNFNTSGGGPENILTCIAAWRDQVYVGTLAGAWRIKQTGTLDSKLPVIAEPVLALASGNAGLYLAVGAKVYCYNDSATQAISPLGGLPADITVISLFVTAADTLLAGTLAHGIWRRAGGSWQQVFTPVSVNQIILQPDESVLMSFVQPGSAAADYAISLPVGVELSPPTVAQPGFPLRIIGKNANGSYSLDPGPVILVLKNTSNPKVPLTLQLSLSAAGVAANTVTVESI